MVILWMLLGGVLTVVGICLWVWLDGASTQGGTAGPPAQAPPQNPNVKYLRVPTSG